MKIEFRAGEVVKANCSHAYRITEGKSYTVISFEPEFYDSTHSTGFVWPAYVIVLDDNNQPLHCHAHRFTKLELTA